jgi:hypothetical protein
LLRGKKDKRLTWEETYRETARDKEDWSDLDTTVADGIEPPTATLLRHLLQQLSEQMHGTLLDFDSTET